MDARVCSYLLADVIWQTMCADYVEEKRDLIRAIPKDRKISEIPKVAQVRSLPFPGLNVLNGAMSHNLSSSSLRICS